MLAHPAASNGVCSRQFSGCNHQMKPSHGRGPKLESQRAHFLPFVWIRCLYRLPFPMFWFFLALHCFVWVENNCLVRKLSCQKDKHWSCMWYFTTNVSEYCLYSSHIRKRIRITHSNQRRALNARIRFNGLMLLFFSSSIQVLFFNYRNKLSFQTCSKQMPSYVKNRRIELISPVILTMFYKDRCKKKRFKDCLHNSCAHSVFCENIVRDER